MKNGDEVSLNKGEHGEGHDQSIAEATTAALVQ